MKITGKTDDMDWFSDNNDWWQTYTEKCSKGTEHSIIAQNNRGNSEYDHDVIVKCECGCGEHVLFVIAVN